MPSFEDFYFDSSTGKNRIHARKCLPDSAPRAVVQIEHGIAEHINRYDDFMSFLAEHGFVAVGKWKDGALTPLTDHPPDWFQELQSAL